MKKLLSIIGLAVAMLLPITAIAGPTVKPVKRYSHLKMDEDRTVLIKGPIRAGMADEIVREVYDLGQLNNKPIYYIINTNGGSLMAGNQIIRAMESSGTRSICVVDRAAYSMGALILTHCDVAYIHKDASVLFHEGYMRMEGRMSEVFSYVSFEKKEFDKLTAETASRLRMSLADYTAKQKDEWWLSAEDAARLGLVQGIINKLQYPVPEQKGFFSIIFGLDDYYNWNTEDGVYDLTYYPTRPWLNE